MQLDFEIAEDIAERKRVLQGIREKVAAPREGIHVSDLVLCLGKAYWRKVDPIPPSDDQVLLYLTGYAFQNYMYPAEEKEAELDGICYNPDVATGVEVKSTRESINKFSPDKHEHWIRQIAAYAFALKKNEYWLTVLFVLGGYGTTKYKPELRCYKFTFPQKALEENWEWLLERKGVLENAFTKGIPPSPVFAEGWECQLCENNIAGRCLEQRLMLEAITNPREKK